MTDNQTPERKQLAGELKDLYDHDARHQGWREITYSEITEGMRILVVSEYAGVTITREGVVDRRAAEGWWSGGVFVVSSAVDSTIYTDVGGAEPEVRRPIKAGELLANIGATIERTETFEIVADPDSPLGWCYRGVRGAKARYVVIAEADPDASILATIRESLDVSDPDESDEMARQVLAGLRAAGLVSRS